MIKRQSGFTMIELVIVIIIIGILAATALPRFLNLQAQARQASAEAAQGSVRAASAIAHSGFLAQQLAGNAPLTMEGLAITMCNGYPTADAAGIIAAAQVTAQDYTITPVAGATADLNSVTITPLNVATPANCQVTYTAAAGGGSCTAPGNAPAVAIVTTNCN